MVFPNPNPTEDLHKQDCLSLHFPLTMQMLGRVFFTDAEPVDQGEEPAFCWVTEWGLYLCNTISETFSNDFHAHLLSTQKTTGKDQLYS